MTRNRSATFFAGAAAVPLAALAVAGCGGSSSGSTGVSAAASHPKTTSSRTATVRVANSRLGKILINSSGRTLYLFKKDSGKKSKCFGQCATFWPPLRATGKPTVGTGLSASKVATTTRSDGKPQVTYNGHPLYTFAMDKKRGDTNGEGVTAFGASWFAVSPAGRQISPKSSKSASGSSSSRPAAPAAPKASPTPTAPPAPKASPPKSNGIPQNNGGDGDADNNGGPSDGDGNI